MHRARHQLGAQADAQRRPLLLQATLQQRDAVGEERVGRSIVDADRATQHHQQIGIFGSIECIHACLHDLDLPSLREQQRLQGAKIFKGHVLQGNGALHAGAPGVGQ